MIRDFTVFASHRLMAPAAVLLAANRATACAVCFGDPDSSMAKGATVGVLVLLGVVGLVMAGIVGTGLFWMHRGRRPVAGDSAHPSPGSADRRDG